MRIFTIIFIGMALLTAFSPLVAQTTYTWIGGDSTWNEPANWSPNGVPGTGDNVIIGSGTVKLTTNVQVKDLVLAAGAITGSANLSIAGQMSWISGSMAGSGATTINSGAELAISGSDHKNLIKRTLSNQGTVTWTGSGELKLRNHAHIENESGALFEIENNVRMDYVLADSGGSFTNAGTLTKSAGGGETQIDPVFINTASGVVNANSGILRFERGDTTVSSAGTFNIAAGDYLALAERSFLFDGATFTGSGTVQILDVDEGVGVVVDVRGSGVTVGAGVTMELNEDKAFFKGSGPVVIDGTFRLIDGAITGTGAFTVNGAFDFNGSSTKSIDGRTITVAGSMYRTGTGLVELSNNATISIQSGAIFDIQTDGTLDYLEPLGGSVTNAGAVIKSAGAGLATIDLPLSNTGAITVNSGTLRLTRGGSHTGTTLTVAAGKLLNFNGGVHSLDNILLGGSGTVQFSGDSVKVLGGGLSVDATTTLTISGGVVAGSGNITANGVLNWSRGTITGSGALTANAALNITGSGTKTLKGRTLTNTLAATWSGTGNINLENGGIIMNLPGASFNVQTDADLNANSLLDEFNNAGTLTKSAGTSTTVMETNFTNTGLVNINTGKVQLEGNSTQTGTIFTIAAGATFEIKEATHTLQDITLNGSGVLLFNEPVITLSGTGLTVNSPAIFTMNGSASTVGGAAPLTVWGTFNWNGGTLSGLSAFTINGLLNIGSTSTKTLSGMVLTNNAATTLSGTGQFRLSNVSLVSNQPGAFFDIQSDASIFFSDLGGGSMNNAGTLSKSGGITTSSIGVFLTNTGTVNLSSGTLRLSNSGSLSNHAVNFSNGATLLFDNKAATYTLDSLVFNGSGAVFINSASMNIIGDGITVNSGATLLMDGDGANVFGSGPITINGNFTWNRGTISGGAPFILNGASAISTTSSKTLNARTLSNNGAISWNGTGTVELENNAKIVNQAAGSFLIQTDGIMDFINPLGGTFENAGLMAKQAGAGISTIDVSFQNNGMLEAGSGTLAFTAALVNDTTGVIRGSAILDLSAATFFNYGTFAPGTSPGILTVSGNYAQSDTAALDIELGGTTAGSEYDRLAVSGNANLGGHLNVNFINGFLPQLGDQFDVMLFGGRSGDFDSLNLPYVGIGKALDTAYTPGSLQLSVIAVGTRANLKLWMEGPYSSAAMQTGLNAGNLLPLNQPFNNAPWNYSGAESAADIPDGIVDWVLVELRSDTTAVSVVASRAAWLQSNGSVLDIDGVTPLTFDVPHDNYYVVVHHRNHLSIMSATALPLNEASPLYDFTTAQSQAYGANPMKELEPGVFGMYAGDADADGSIGAADRDSAWRVQNGTEWEYGKSGDFNLDGGIDASDLNLYWRPNLGKTTRVPAAPPAPKFGGKERPGLQTLLNQR